MPSSQPLGLTTADGVVLHGLHWDVGVRDVGCVVAHGFTGSSRTPAVQAICRALVAAGCGVLAIDARGHGRSGGRSTVGADEIHDIAAGVTWMRAHGYGRAAVLGWSMGGSAVLRYAGLGGDADAVVSVSSPGRWFERGTRPMRIVHWLCETRTGRVVVRVGRRTRLAGPTSWATVPEAPHEVVGDVPGPLLVVHGDSDTYFPIEHVELLQEAAPDAEFWIEPGMGHAESATTPELVARIADWVKVAVATVPVSGDR